MKAAQHTTGPWKTNKNAAGNIWIQAQGRFIAEITPAYGEVPESIQAERQANARLIASAPELLEALQSLLESRNPENSRNARAAIERATNP